MKKTLATILLATGAASAFAADTLLGGNAVLERISGNIEKGNMEGDSIVFSGTGAGGVLDWSKFNIGSGQQIYFHSAYGVTFFNLVSADAGTSQIDGAIRSGGNVWVINPNGIVFGSGSYIRVAGLFAAAAGNISNADALREGLATLPEFSSMSGDIEMNSVDPCIAAQMALFGKKVSIDGADLRGVHKLTVAAGDKIVVDDAGGGLIKLSIADFTDGLDDIGIELGGIELGGEYASQQYDGDAELLTEGYIAIKNDIEAVGDVTMSTVAAANASSQTISYKNISVASGKLLQGKSVNAVAAGDVGVEADTTDGVGMIASETTAVIEAGGDIGIAGSVVGKTGVTLTAGGDVVIDGGLVKAGAFAVPTDPDARPDIEQTDRADLTIASGAGTTIKNGAKLGASQALEITASGVGADGSGVVIDGATVVANTDMSVIANATSGDIEVKGGAYVAANSEVVVDALNGKLTVSGETTSVESVGDLALASDGGTTIDGARVGSNADVVINAMDSAVLVKGGATVLAKENIEIGNDSTSTTIDGSTLWAKKDVTVAGGGLTVENGASVTGETGVNANVTGDVSIDNSVVKAGAFAVPTDGSEPEIAAGDAASMTISADGNIEAKNGSQVAASDALVLAAAGDTGVTISGATVASKGDMTITATGVDGGGAGIATVSVTGGYVGTRGTLTATASKDVSVAGSLVESEGDMSVEATEGGVTVGDTSRVGTSGNLAVTAGGADGIAANGAIVAGKTGTKATLTAAEGSVSAVNAANDFNSVEGSAKGDFAVAGKNDVTLGPVTSEEGSVTATAGGNLNVVAEGGKIDASTDVVLEGASVVVTGDVEGDSVTVNSALDHQSGTITADTVTLKDAATQTDGAVVKTDSLVLDATGKDVALASADNEIAAVSGTAGSLDLTTKTALDLGADLTGGAVSLEATGGITQSAGTLTATTLTLKSDALVQGTVVADGIDATGTTLTIDGGTVTVQDATDKDATVTANLVNIVTGTATVDMIAADLSIAAGSLDVLTLTGDATVTGGTVEAGIIDGSLTQSAGSVTVSGAISGDVTISDGTLVADTIGGTPAISGGSVTVSELVGDIALDNATTQVTTGKITGNLELANGTVLGKDGALEVTGTTQQSGGTIGAATDAVTLDGALAQTGGEIKATTLTLGADSSVGGTVVASVAVAAGENDIEVTDTGSLSTPAVTAAALATAGTVNADLITADVTQTEGAVNSSGGTGVKIAGSFTQSQADGKTASLGSAAETVEITGTLDQDAGTISATTLTLGANSTVAGTVTAEKIDATGTTLTQDGAGTVTVTGADGITATKLVQASTGTVKTDKVTGDVDQTGAATLAANDPDNGLEVTGALSQSDAGASAGSNGEDVSLGSLAQTAGTVTTKTLTLGADSSVGGTVVASVAVAAGENDIEVTDTGALSAPAVTAAALATAGTVNADLITADVTQTEGAVSSSGGTGVKIAGSFTQSQAEGKTASLGSAAETVEITGSLDQDAGTISATTLTLGANSTVAGTVTAEKIDATGTTLTQDGVGTVTVTGADGIVATKLVQASTGTVKTDKVTGDVDQTGAAMLAANDPDNGLEVTGALSQSDAGASAGSNGENVSLGSLAQTAGTVTTKTLTLGADSSVGGTVVASVAVAADGKNLEVTDTGVLSAPTVTADTVATAGDVDVDLITADVTQTEGTINSNGGAGVKIAGTFTQIQADGKTAVLGSAAETVEITGTLDQDAGTISATTLTLGADSTVAGTVAAEKIDATGATLTQDGAGTVTVTGADGITATKLVQASTGTVKTDKVTGDVDQTGAATLAANDPDNGLEVTGALSQSDAGASAGSNAEDVSVGSLAQTAGTVTTKTLTLGADSSVDGTVVASVAVAAGENDIEVTDTGSLSTPAVTAAALATAGTVNADLITADVTQTEGAVSSYGGTGVKIAGSFTQSQADGKTASLGSAAETVEITGTLDQDAGTISATTLTLGANSTVGGTVTAEKIDATGTTLTQDGAGTVTVTGADGITATKLVQASTGTVKTDKVTGDVDQTGAAMLAANDPNNGLEVTGALSQSNAGASAGSNGEDVSVGSLAQTAGTVTTKTLTLGADSSVGGTVVASVAVAAGENDIEVTDTGSLSTPAVTAAALATAGTVNADLITADVTQTEGAVSSYGGTGVKIAGSFTQSQAEGKTASLGSATEAVEITGTLDQDAGTISATTLTLGADSTVAGTVAAEKIDATGATLTQDGAGTVTVTGADGITATKLVQASTGTVKTDKVTGDVDQTGAATLAANDPDNGLEVTGALSQSDAGASAGSNGENVSLGSLAQTAGTVTARTMTLGADSTVSGTVTAENINASDTTFTVEGATVTATDIKAKTLEVLNGTVVTTTITGSLKESGGDVKADSVSGNVGLSGGQLKTGVVGGDFTFSGGTFVAKDNSLTVTGETTQEVGTKLGDSDDTFVFQGGLTQDGGDLEAAKTELGDDSVVKGTVDVAEIDASGKTLTVDGATVTAGNITAETLNVDVGSLSADTIEAGTVDVDGGMVVADSVTADKVDVGGGAFTAAKLDGNLTQTGGTVASDDVTGNVDLSGGQLTTSMIAGDFKYTGGTVVANNDSLKVNGPTTQEAGTTIGDGGDSIELLGGLVQNGGTINVATLTLGGTTTQEEGASIVTPDLVLAADGKDVSLGSSANAISKVTGSAKSFAVTTGDAIVVDDASATDGNASVTASNDITVKKIAASNTVTLRSQNGSVVGAGASNVTADGLVISAKTGIGTEDAPLETDVGHLEAESSSGGVYIHDVGAVDVRSISAADDVDLSSADDMTISGTVRATGTADVSSGADVILSGGTVSGDTVNVIAASDITQAGSAIADFDGYADASGVRSSIVASGTATLVSTGGSIGSVGEGSMSYVGVDAGSVKANANRDVAIAGTMQPLKVDVGGITGGGNVALYAPNTIVTDGTIDSGDRITITAGSFSGGILNVNPGKSLATYNFVNGLNPLIAIFNSVSGGNADPEIENLPNHALVFLDGRVAGGDLKTINQLGSVEAFPVQTPELKSEQGVFGNPTFLHGELDVANPLAVGAIDFILQEIPRQTFSSDFPVEVDQQILANGLNPTTSYWFGQHPQAEDESAGDAIEDGESEEQ